MARSLTWFAVLVLVGLTGAGCLSPAGFTGPVHVTSTNYAGWSGSYLIRNDEAEIVVVPAIGRVMRFGYVGAPSVLWENNVLLGSPMPTNPWETPGSFGGDKTWPAPQDAWSWPPPKAFDATAVEARVEGDAVVLTSPVDSRFGIRTERRIMLNPFDAVMRIQTTYEKVEGAPVEVSVWVISQFRDPVGVYFRVPPDTRFAQGWNHQWGTNHVDVTTANGVVKVTRNHTKPHKIGSDAGALLWVGTEDMCLVETSRESTGRFPDNGSRVEIYTNPDPAAYVELETLGPLQTLRVGEKLSALNVYTLKKRRRMDPDADARPVLPR